MRLIANIPDGTDTIGLGLLDFSDNQIKYVQIENLTTIIKIGKAKINRGSQER